MSKFRFFFLFDKSLFVHKISIITKLTIEDIHFHSNKPMIYETDSSFIFD